MQGGNPFSTGKRSYKHSIIFTKTIKSDHDKGRVRHSFLNDSQFIIKKIKGKDFVEVLRNCNRSLTLFERAQVEVLEPFFLWHK